MFINIHTHQSPAPGEKAILSLYRDFDKVNQPGFYSVGVHPWYISEDYPAVLDVLEKIAGHKQVRAIGEIGLDKRCHTAMERQEIVFRAQLQLAKRLQKPVIIHCVRAWSELLTILEEENTGVPVIFHGFNKGSKLAHQLIQKGYYLSFGKSLQHQNIRILLPSIPVEKIFLETDDASIGIRDLYQLASTALQTDLPSLEEQLAGNTRKVFGI